MGKFQPGDRLACLCLARYGGLPLHLGLEVDAQGIGNPVDVVEVAAHLDGGVDLFVGGAGGAKGVDVFLGAGRRGRGDLGAVVEEWCELRVDLVEGGTGILVEQTLAPVVGPVLGDLGTEILFVGLGSIEAVVQPRDPDGDQLAEPPWEW